MIVWGWLWRWWHGQRRRDGLHVVLYTRHGCHLCEVALAELERWRWRYGFRLEVIDIDSDPELVAAHGNHVPVVTVNGKVRFRVQVNRILFLRLLRGFVRGSAADNGHT